MIAIGGSIGTGLFVASGASVSQAGPGGALLAYAVVGLMVYFLMTSLGEMAAYLPTSGSFATYGARYVDEGFGFALGWNYWYNWAVTIAVDLVAAQLVMAYWFPGVDGVLWSAVFLAIMFGLNAISVRGFGEAEYWFAAIKVATVIVFIGIGVLMILGIMRGGAPEGLELCIHDPIPFDPEGYPHDVAAGRVPDLTDTVRIRDLPHVPGVHKMVHDPFAVHDDHAYRSGLRGDILRRRSITRGRTSRT